MTVAEYFLNYIIPISLVQLLEYKLWPIEDWSCSERDNSQHYLLYIELGAGQLIQLVCNLASLQLY